MSIFNGQARKLGAARRSAELAHAWVDGTDLSLYPDSIRRGEEPRREGPTRP
jgi:hypothetical protein